MCVLENVQQNACFVTRNYEEKIMKRITGSLIMTGLLLTITVIAHGAETRPIKIGFILKTMQEERYQTDKSLFIAKAETLGAEVVFDSSSNNELVQLRQVEKMLDEGIQVLVLQPVNTGTAGNLVRLAHDKGIKVIGYDSMLQGGPLDIMVMQDSWAVGKLQGEAMLEWLTEKKGLTEGKVALIMGQPGDANAAAMSVGVLEVIKEHSGLDLIAQRSHVDWSPDLARETTDALLIKYDNAVDAFVCNNSGLASGVIAALELEGLAEADKVFVAGSDADLQNIQFIAQGKQTIDIWKKIKPVAYAAVEIAIAAVNNPEKDVSEIAQGSVTGDLRFELIHNGFTDVPTVITPVVLITKDTIDETLIAEKFFTKEQVYGKEQ
jgi:D-xylose transport system substrate-binding protein